MKKELIKFFFILLKKYVYITYEGVTLENEYWEARELLHILGYVDWRKFNNTIQKAKTACSKSGFRTEDHFVGIDRMVGLCQKIFLHQIKV